MYSLYSGHTCPEAPQNSAQRQGADLFLYMFLRGTTNSDCTSFIYIYIYTKLDFFAAHFHGEQSIRIASLYITDICWPLSHEHSGRNASTNQPTHQCVLDPIPPWELSCSSHSKISTRGDWNQSWTNQPTNQWLALAKRLVVCYFKKKRMSPSDSAFENCGFLVMKQASPLIREPQPHHLFKWSKYLFIFHEKTDLTMITLLGCTIFYCGTTWIYHPASGNQWQLILLGRALTQKMLSESWWQQKSPHHRGGILYIHGGQLFFFSGRSLVPVNPRSGLCRNAASTRSPTTRRKAAGRCPMGKVWTTYVDWYTVHPI